jgi:hypothetical protein
MRPAEPPAPAVCAACGKLPPDPGLTVCGVCWGLGQTPAPAPPASETGDNVPGLPELLHELDAGGRVGSGNNGRVKRLCRRAAAAIRALADALAAIDRAAVRHGRAGEPGAYYAIPEAVYLAALAPAAPPPEGDDAR